MESWKADGTEGEGKGVLNSNAWLVGGSCWVGDAGGSFWSMSDSLRISVPRFQGDSTQSPVVAQGHTEKTSASGRTRQQKIDIGE